MLNEYNIHSIGNLSHTTNNIFAATVLNEFLAVCCIAFSVSKID